MVPPFTYCTRITFPSSFHHLCITVCRIRAKYVCQARQTFFEHLYDSPTAAGI